jgi:hypothetical protein
MGNPPAETINGFYKAEIPEHEGPWRGKNDVELATLHRVHRYNEKRLYGPLGHISPATAKRTSAANTSRPERRRVAISNLSGEPGLVRQLLLLFGATFTPRPDTVSLDETSR